MALRQHTPVPRKKPRFSSTEHLGPEAVAAFADRELSPAALHRARVHIVQCDECRAEVNHQRAAAEQLRCCNADESVRAPKSLVQRLTQMPAEPIGDEPRTARPVTDFVSIAYRALKGRGSTG